MDETLTPELIMEGEAIPELYMEENMAEVMPISADIDPAIFAAIAGFGIISMIIGMAVLVAMIIAWWKIFKKANQPGWAALIPFYNIYVMLTIVKMSPLLMLILIGFFIPFVNFFVMIAWAVVMVIMWHRLSLAFGKGIGYTLGLIFLNPIFALMLAFGNAQYTEPTSEDPDAPKPPQEPQQSSQSQTDASPMSSPDME